MLTKYELWQLLDTIQSDDSARRDAAWLELLRHDEDAVEPLIEEFYSGVNEATGLVILESLGAIGGPDALLALVDVANNAPKESWREIAAKGVQDNGWDDVLKG